MHTETFSPRITRLQTVRRDAATSVSRGLPLGNHGRVWMVVENVVVLVDIPLAVDIVIDALDFLDPYLDLLGGI